MTSQVWQEIFKGLWETVYSSLAATLFATLIGIPVGVVLALTGGRGLKPNPIVNKTVGIVVNVLRSIPFLILFVAVMPFTHALAGTSIGATATIVPLTLAAAPFVARLTETSLKEVDAGVTEAALACGASTVQIVWKALLPEALPSLLANGAITLVTVVGYSAMAGFCGGGGLGGIAINYGYYRGNETVMLVTVCVIVVVVQIFQEVGLLLAKLRDRRKKNK